MSKINILSSKIYNRIAAGEVVDRPYSVVKELVENSIDAKATNITVEIQNGGISFIEITDNGCGIEKKELKKALLPHATSKISSLKDLDDITSLGFRGEALPSIASVSKISIASKTENTELGSKIYYEGGEFINETDCGMSVGTVVTVKNLFFNTPAREKFLRTARSEEAEISSTMARFILGNPNIAFKYIADNEVIYQSFGDGLESAFINVYGTDALKQCFYIDTEKNGFTIKGYVSKHNYNKGTRSYQTVFLNGRYIVNQTISSAISNAYSKYLMKHRYPFYVLNITMPTSTVDINVHPNKLDARFSNNQIVYGTIYSVVSKVLDGSGEALNIIKNTDISNDIDISIKNNSDYVTHNSDYRVEKPITKSFEKLTLSDSSPVSSLPFDDSLVDNKSNNSIDIFEENKAYLKKLEEEKQKIHQKQNLVEQQSFSIKSTVTYVGQVLNTFLILEDGKDMYMVDQHAAHERLLYDNLLEYYSNGQDVRQPLLIPYVINLNNAEFDFIYTNLSIIKSIGIDIEEFGRNSFKINSIPAVLSQMNIDTFFKNILNDLYLLKNISTTEILKEKIAQKACKSAIKAGDKLDMSEIDILIKKLTSNLGLKCPHGRPIAIKITREEIDKWFKRII